MWSRPEGIPLRPYGDMCPSPIARGACAELGVGGLTVVVMVGAWWGPVPTGEGRRTEQREIDAVALGERSEVLALASCKWTGTPTGASEESLLTRLQAHVPGATDAARHCFYSRSGFDGALTSLARDNPERYRLLTPADLYA